MDDAQGSIAQTQTPTPGNVAFQAEAWYVKNVHTIHGKLVLDNTGATMYDDEGQPLLVLPYDRIQEVHLQMGSVEFKSDGHKHWVMFYDRAKFSAQTVETMAVANAVGDNQQIMGVQGGNVNDLSGILLATSKISAQAEAVLRRHVANVVGSTGVDAYKKRMYRARSFGHILGAVMVIVIVIYACIKVLSEH